PIRCFRGASALPDHRRPALTIQMRFAVRLRAAWRLFGETLDPQVRIYLAGRMCVEVPGRGLTDQSALPGRQGRLLLAYLTLRRVPVPREELADVLWPDAPPPSWETALSAVVS